MKTNKKVAKLTVDEDKAWVFAFCFYKDKGYSDLRADASAWLDMKLDFPRLRNFDGCR